MRGSIGHPSPLSSQRCASASIEAEDNAAIEITFATSDGSDLPLLAEHKTGMKIRIGGVNH